MLNKSDTVMGNPQSERDVIQADADYFYTKARQCPRRARQAPDQGAAARLRTLAVKFEETARLLKEATQRN